MAARAAAAVAAVDVVVVGAGHNGLCCAALLAKLGLDVVVFEANERVGGAAATEELVPGVAFPTCAYALHALHERVVEELALDVEVEPLAPRTIVLPDGRRAVETEDALRELLGPAETERWRRWNEQWLAVARVVDRFALEPAPSLADLRRAARADGCEELLERFATCSAVELLHESFATPEARALAAPKYLESDPFAAGSPLAYAWLEAAPLRPERLRGVPRGGMRAVAEAFAAAAGRAGAEIVTGTPVQRVVVEARTARGVELADGRRVDARAVVSNADPKRTFLRLVDAPELVARVRAVETRPAAAKIHFTGAYPAAGLVHLYPRLDWYERAFADAVAGLPPASSLVELQAVGVEGGLSVYVPMVAPQVGAAALAEVVERVRREVPAAREAAAHAPADLEQRHGLTDGAIHHVALTPSQAFDRRPLPGWADGRTPIAGLFLCGAGIHPGGEVSGAPGWNAARTVAKALA